MKKTTTQLLSQISQAKSLQEFQRHNSQELTYPPVLDYYLSLFPKHNIKNKAQAISLSENTSTYVYSVFRGERPLNRNLCLCLALAIGCSITETQTLLKYGGFAQLYPRNPRDLLIIFALNNGYSVVQLEELLSENKQPLLIDEKKGK